MICIGRHVDQGVIFSPLVRACVHGGGGEGPQVGEVTRLGGVTGLSL